MNITRTIQYILILLLVSSFLHAQVKSGGESLGTRTYDDYKTPQFCGTSCHTDFFQQWKQAMMSQAYTHHWDEIEYFDLAVPHAEKDPVVAEVKAGCNGCHTPMAFMSRDILPQWEINILMHGSIFFMVLTTPEKLKERLN